MKKKINLLLFLSLLVGFSWFSSSKVAALELNSGYNGICCQRQSGDCEHPNGMKFEKSTWISGSSTCTGNEDPNLPDPGLEE